MARGHLTVSCVGYLQQPGKLNLKAYSNVTDALSKLAVGEAPPRLLTKPDLPDQDDEDDNAPLATPESVEDLGADYTTVRHYCS